MRRARISVRIRVRPRDRIRARIRARDRHRVPVRGRDRLHHWRITYGSALEARTALELLVATGCVDAQDAATAEALLDRVSAMAWRLVHPAR